MFGGVSWQVDPRARHLLLVDVPAAASGGAQLLKLSVEGLPVGRDAGVADKAFFGISFDPILWQTQPFDQQGAREFAFR